MNSDSTSWNTKGDSLLRQLLGFSKSFPLVRIMAQSTSIMLPMLGDSDTKLPMTLIPKASAPVRLDVSVR